MEIMDHTQDKLQAHYKKLSRLPAIKRKTYGQYINAEKAKEIQMALQESKTILPTDFFRVMGIKRLCEIKNKDYKKALRLCEHGIIYELD